jgi:hypothetical protein
MAPTLWIHVIVSSLAGREVVCDVLTEADLTGTMCSSIA